MVRTATATLLAALAIAVASALPVHEDIHLHSIPTGGDKWAVLVAGSATWSNYRHQADVCHAYQVLKEHGFNEEKIIVMMMDDIAQNQLNPTPGVIINQPGGKNVYAGVKIDYKGKDVTPTNFINVITGNKAAMAGVGSGKVLESTAKDHVFINFVDHGGPNIIAFPTQMLTATQLNQALSKMHTQKMYSQLVFYLEACESGSMFINVLPANTKVYATTASDPTHSSFAIYFDKTRKTYLGDVYSVNWLQNSDSANLRQESLEAQYQVVKQKTNTSHVQEYGDIALSRTSMVSAFLGSGKAATREQLTTAGDAAPEVVSSRDVDVAILRHMVEAATGEEEHAAAQAKLNAELAKRLFVRGLFEEVVAIVDGPESVERHMAARLQSDDAVCVETATLAFHDHCVNLGQEHYGLEHTFSFVSMCVEGAPASAIVAAIKTVCPTRHEL